MRTAWVHTANLRSRSACFQKLSIMLMICSVSISCRRSAGVQKLKVPLPHNHTHSLTITVLEYLQNVFAKCVLVLEDQPQWSHLAVHDFTLLNTTECVQQ